MTALRSPVTGAPLAPDTATTLSDGHHRWPVVDGIPYLRAGRDALRDRAVAALDGGDPAEAAVALLADQDDWWDEAPPSPESRRRALGATTLREAVDRLGLGRVGDYFLHRDHDPSGLAVLGLTAAHPPAGRGVLDLACGAGHLLRHLALHGHRDLTGLDVVFAKLWLARRFVLPDPDAATLVCADLTAPWPVAVDGGPRWVALHDALYFFDDPAALVDAAVERAGPEGAVLAAHCHHVDHPLAQAGRPRSAPGWSALLPGATTYAEEELTSAVLEHRAPVAADVDELGGTEAVALARDTDPARFDAALLDPPPDAAFTLNPLYVDRVRHWPSERWAAEYGARAATYLPEILPAERAHGRHDRHRRLLVALPERW